MYYKRIITALAMFLLFPVAALPQTMYVTDLMEITMRTGKGLDRKIIAMPQSGQRVEVLTSEGDWTQVRLPNGKEGWVLSRFLTSSEPKFITLEKLEKKYQTLTQQVDRLTEESQKLKTENQRLSTELKTRNDEINRLKTAYENLKNEASDFMELKASHEHSTQKLQEVTRKAEKVESELFSIRKQQNIRWFLAGAGVLMVGFLIGFSFKKQRKRSSLI